MTAYAFLSLVLCGPCLSLGQDCHLVNTCMPCSALRHQIASCGLAGLEVAGLSECLEALLELALAVHDRCAASTTALLDMLDTGMRLSGSPKCGPGLFQYTSDRAHWLKAHTHGLLLEQRD